MSVLRKLFGPSREEIWRQLAAEIGAAYIEGGFWKRDQVEASHGEWTVTLDTYFDAALKADFTRLRAPFVNPEGFRFTVYRRGLFSDVAKLLGMQDIELGYAEFDQDFIIKGTHEAKLRALFDHVRIRQLVSAQREIHFSVQAPERRRKRGLRANTDELSFKARGVLKDPDRLKQLFDLFAETLDQLCRIGAAYEDGR